MKTYKIIINSTEFDIDAGKIEIAVRRGVESWLQSTWDKKGDPTIALTAQCVLGPSQHKRKAKAQAEERQAAAFAQCEKTGHTMYSRHVCYTCRYVTPCQDCSKKSETMFTLPDNSSVAMCRACIIKRYQLAGLPPPPRGFY